MASRSSRWLWGLIVVAVTAACGSSPQASFYTLDSTVRTKGAPVANAGVMVGPVSVPGSVDRPEMVVRVGPNRVEIDELHRWAGPLGEGIARTVAGDLAVLLDTPDVAVAPFANFDPAYRVTINVQRFDSAPGEEVVSEAVWTVRSTKGGAVHSGRTVARESVQATGFAALAASHSRALAKLSRDIAGGIRAAVAAD